MDKLTRAAFIHPVNPHQLLLSSEQSLIIMDERFTNSPVIAINHSMRSSPRFMQTWTYEKESSLHTMAFLAGYKHRDTRCLEFEQSSLANNWTSLQTNSLRTNPVTCTRKPWRVREKLHFHFEGNESWQIADFESIFQQPEREVIYLAD